MRTVEALSHVVIKKSRVEWLCLGDGIVKPNTSPFKMSQLVSQGPMLHSSSD